MKNTVKRLAVVLIAFATIISMVSVALAAGITVQKSDGSGIKADSTFAAYRVFKWEAREDGSDVYTNIEIMSDFEAFFENSVYGDYDLDKIIALPAEEMADLTSQLQYYARDNALSSTATSNGGVFDSLEYGYYLVVETATAAESATVASKAMLVSVPSFENGAWNDAVVINAKDSSVGDDKDIVEGQEYVDSGIYSMGDTVKFEYVADIPKYDATAADITYYVTDTFDKGLTYNDDLAISADGVTLTLDLHYQVEKTTNENGETILKITFDYETVKQYSAIKAEYSAILNENAVVGNTGNLNRANVTYTRVPASTITGEPEQTTTTDDKITIVYTGEIAITKVDAEGNPLEGVEFEIYSDADCTIPATCHEVIIKKTYNPDGSVATETKELRPIENEAVTDEDGLVRFVGLIPGTYYVKETKALPNYNILTDAIVVEVTAENIPEAVVTGDEEIVWGGSATLGETILTVDVTDGPITFSVVNTLGATFPGTGGMGTTVFTVIGVTMLLSVAVIYTVYRRKESAK